MNNSQEIDYNLPGVLKKLNQPELSDEAIFFGEISFSESRLRKKKQIAVKYTR